MLGWRLLLFLDHFVEQCTIRCLRLALNDKHITVSPKQAIIVPPLTAIKHGNVSINGCFPAVLTTLRTPPHSRLATFHSIDF